MFISKNGHLYAASGRGGVVGRCVYLPSVIRYRQSIKPPPPAPPPPTPPPFPYPSARVLCCAQADASLRIFLRRAVFWAPTSESTFLPLFRNTKRGSWLAPYLDAFSKVSALLHLLCKVTNQRTFQNAYMAVRSGLASTSTVYICAPVSTTYVCMCVYVCVCVCMCVYVCVCVCVTECLRPLCASALLSPPPVCVCVREKACVRASA